jgi:hypothetical protein
MEAGRWKQDIWDTTKAIFWGLAIFSFLINALNVIIGADSLGIYIFIFSLIGLACALFLTFLKNKQDKKLEIFNR